MIHGYHVILVAYGVWLPNDPRGSWSEFVGKWELTPFGRTTRSLARRELIEFTDAELRRREAAQKTLKYPCVRFDGPQALAIGRGFAAACERNGYGIRACSILPEHTHLVIAGHRYAVEQIVNLLKGAATRTMIEEDMHPQAEYAEPGKRPPRMWAEYQWKAFLDSDEAIENAIRYVENNPIEEGEPVQHWSFVTPFTGLDPGWVTYH